MRTNGVKMAIYDEPSASLDPRAEFGPSFTLLVCPRLTEESF